jgi:hypothetical protein
LTTEINGYQFHTTPINTITGRDLNMDNLGPQQHEENLLLSPEEILSDKLLDPRKVINREDIILLICKYNMYSIFNMDLDNVIEIRKPTAQDLEIIRDLQNRELQTFAERARLILAELGGQRKEMRLGEGVPMRGSGQQQLRVSYNAGKYNGGQAPSWLGLEGFEERTREWLENCDLATGEEANARETDSMIANSIQVSKDHLLSTLELYSSYLEDENHEVDQSVAEAAKKLIVQAKGKGKMHQYDEQAEFATLLKQFAKEKHIFETLVDQVLHDIDCYARQCFAANVEIDEEVVREVRRLLTSVGRKDSTKETSPVDEMEQNTEMDEQSLEGVVDAAISRPRKRLKR